LFLEDQQCFVIDAVGKKFTFAWLGGWFDYSGEHTLAPFVGEGKGIPRRRIMMDSLLGYFKITLRPGPAEGQLPGWAAGVNQWKGREET
jgi:hypothetical protein